MTRERLELLTLHELKIIARNYRIEECEDRETLITQLLDFFAEASQEREEGHNLLVLGEARKYSVCRDEEIDPQVEDENEIPSSYAETRIVALVRSPQWAYVYWDIQRARLKAAMSSKGGLRRVVLRVSCIDEESSFDIPLKETDEHRYIHLPQPGCAYVMELVGKNTDQEHVLASSNVIRTPRGAPAEDRPSDDPILRLSDPFGSEAGASSLEVSHRVSTD